MMKIISLSWATVSQTTWAYNVDLKLDFDYLLWLCLEGGRQHVGEEFQSYRKQELHEGDDDEHQEGKKSEDVGTCSEELGTKFGQENLIRINSL